jgi:hypothetical protein
MKGRSMEVDVEAILYALQNCGLVDIVVTGVYHTEGLWPALLCGSNGGPKDSFAAASCIAAIY